MTPSPGVLNAFELYQARLAGKITTQLSPKDSRYVPPISEETKQAISTALENGKSTYKIAAELGLSRVTINRFKARLRKSMRPNGVAE